MVAVRISGLVKTELYSYVVKDIIDIRAKSIRFLSIISLFESRTSEITFPACTNRGARGKHTRFSVNVYLFALSQMRLFVRLKSIKFLLGTMSHPVQLPTTPTPGSWTRGYESHFWCCEKYLFHFKMQYLLIFKYWKHFFLLLKIKIWRISAMIKISVLIIFHSPLRY